MRIIHCALSCAGLLANLEHEKLRPLEPGIVAAVGDDVLDEVLAADSGLAMLFFSREAYDDAIRGLSEPEVDRALRDRLTRWSPNVLEDAFAIITAGEKRALALTAHAQAQLSNQAAQALREHFSQGLDLLASFSSEGRFDEMDILEFLEMVIEKEALLLAELKGSEEATMRTNLARTLAEELKRLGDPDFAEALPHKEPLRGVWIAPADEKLMESLRWRGAPVLRFREGIVTVTSARLLQQPPFVTKETRTLYIDPGQFYEDVSELNAPELKRRLEQRFIADEASHGQDRINYLNALRLEQALIRRIIYRRATKDHSPLTSDVGRQVDVETEALMNQLARSNTWLGRDGNVSTLTRLAESEDNILRDVHLLLSLSKRKSDQYMVRRLSGVLLSKEADRKRLESLRK